MLSVVNPEKVEDSVTGKVLEVCLRNVFGTLPEAAPGLSTLQGWDGNLEMPGHLGQVAVCFLSQFSSLVTS